MQSGFPKIELPEIDAQPRQKGYTFLEILGVTTIMIIVVLMTQGMLHSYKKYSTEESAVQRLKELSRFEHAFRYANDPTVNPDRTYGTFFDLQNAGYIPEVYDQSDDRRHTTNAYVPFYRLDFVKSDEEDDLEPDGFQYLIRAIPLYNSMGLKTFYVQEDGEVYYHRFWWINPR
jgi:type II secretory pathway pseudopilin PulG